MTMHKTFMGSCDIGGCTIAATSMSSGFEIKPGFYDHIFGLRDEVNPGAKGPGIYQPRQKTLYRWLPGIAKMSISGIPLQDSGFGSLYRITKEGDDTSGNIKFWENDDITTLDGKISQLSISCQAGDNVNVSVELTSIGRDDEIRKNKDIKRDIDGCMIPMNWVDFYVNCDIGDEVTAFSININNPIKPIYLGGNLATELRVGIQEITGSVTTIGGVNWKKEGLITFGGGCNSDEFTIRCLFEGSKFSGDSGGLAIVNTNFYGIAD